MNSRSVPATRCDACGCAGNTPGEPTDVLWSCAECGGTFHAGCSGAYDDHPDMCDDCANEATDGI